LPDLVVANFGSSNVSVLLGNGDGTFQTAVNVPIRGHPYSVAVGDFDRDGRLDLAVANRDGNAVSILSGNGDGTFQNARNVTSRDPVFVAVADFNGDGTSD